MPEFVAPDVWLKGGLFDRKHIEAMGEAIWLYGYFQGIVRRTGEHAGNLPPGQIYQHRDAVEALGMPRRRIERWFAVLTTPRAALGGQPYVVAVRRRLGYELTITKYEDLRVRAAERRSRPATSGASQKPEIRQNAHSDTPNPVVRPAKSGARHATSGASHDPSIKEAGAQGEQLNSSTDQQGESARPRETSGHTPESIALYCRIRQTTLSAEAAKAIAKAVPETPGALAMWRGVVETCEVNGVGKANVKCALDWFGKGIPEKYRLSGQAAPAVKRAAPERPELTPEQEAASDAERERVKADMAARGLLRRYSQIGKTA